MMNGKERVQAAMRLGKPDRVPVMCQLSTGHYFLNSGVAPLDIWFTSSGFATALENLADRYRFDGILVNLPGRDPRYEEQIDRIEEKEGQTWVWWKNGNLTKVPHDDNPVYCQADGSKTFPTFDEIDPERLFYVEPWDLTGVTWPFTWDFESEPRPFEDFFPPYGLDALRTVVAHVGDRLSVHSEVFSPFTQFVELLDYSNALMALMTDPGKAHACLARLALGAGELAWRQAGAGARAVLISSPFAGAGFISRDHYSEFVLPYERQVVRALKDAHPGVSVYTHTCGAIGDRLDLMLETGTEGIDTLDPPPLGTVDLAEAVGQLKGKAFIKGNLDPVGTLLYGSREAVRRAVEERMRLAKPGGGYILSSACSVAPRTPPGTLEYLSELARELGVY